MRVLSQRRRVSGGGSSNLTSCSIIYLITVFMLVAVLVVLLSEQSGVLVSQQRRLGRRLKAGAGISLWPYHILRQPERSTNRTLAGERFATLFHSELVKHFGYTESSSVPSELMSTLKNLESLGITTVIFSSPWAFFQPEDRAIEVGRLDALINATCQNTKLKVALIIDMVRAPSWLFKKWPDAKTMDSHKKSYSLLSWFHAPANQLAVDVLTEVVAHLVTTFPGCVTAVQPGYSNEYEARYTQENDCFQDYSPPAIATFQQWLQNHNPYLDGLNGRWGTNFTSWEAVTPPFLESGSFMGPDMTPRYWDFISFRELYGAKVLNTACAAVQKSGARCFHHVPEIFTVLDAVYGTTIFKHIAASPNTDFLIVNSNFKAARGAVLSPTKTRLGVAAAVSYGKKVFFEASLEHSPSMGSVEAAVSLAITTGADGVGISNWMGKYDPGPQLRAALQPVLSPCRVSELVGVFVHLDSCSAFHGLQWDYPRKDPVHDLVQSIAEPLSASCGTSISVFVELANLVAALPSLDRVVFMEPVVLLGDAQLEMYTQAKEAVRGMVHQFVQLPFNQTRGIRMAVMPDL